MMQFFKKVKSRLVNIVRDKVEKNNLKNMRKNNELWKVLNDYMAKSKSTGCQYSDYWELYSFVRKNKPKEILECGTGVSTIVMAYALLENEKEGYNGRITSVESVKEYYEMAKEILPVHIAPYVDLICSPLIEDYYALFRGVRYKDVPLDRTYDFVYVDGPSYTAPSDGTIAFDFDYLHIVKNSDKPVYAIIDKRVSTCYVFQKIFGLEKVKYNALIHLGFAGPCSKEDIKHFVQKFPSSAFGKSFKPFGKTELNLKLNDLLFKDKNEKK